MSWATTNLENVLDVDKLTDWFQVPDTFETNFQNANNRQILVNAAKENFVSFDEATKEQLKNTSADEIASWGKYPETSDKWYNAKVGVLYLYTSLSDNNQNPSLADVKVYYDKLQTKNTQNQTTVNKSISESWSEIKDVAIKQKEVVESEELQNIKDAWNTKTINITLFRNPSDYTQGTTNFTWTIIIDDVASNEGGSMYVKIKETWVTLPISKITPEYMVWNDRDYNLSYTIHNSSWNNDIIYIEGQNDNNPSASSEIENDVAAGNAKFTTSENTGNPVTNPINNKTNTNTPDIVLGGVENPITIPIIPETNTTPETTKKETRTERQEDRKNKRTERIETRQEKKTERTEDNLNKKNTIEIEKNKLPDDLQNIKIGGEWTQKKENYIFTPTDKKSSNELRNDNLNGLRKFEDQYEVGYFGKENNPSSPVTYISFSPKKNIEETYENQKDTIIENEAGDGATISVFSQNESFLDTKSEGLIKKRVSSKINETQTKNNITVNSGNVSEDNYEIINTHTYEPINGKYNMQVTVKLKIT